MQRSTSTKSLLRAALSAGVAAGAFLAAVPHSAAKVGVTAAVNVDARGRAPGAAPRVLALGNTVVFDEEITTDGSGLVQILLLDGTTFTVGPNSQLTIDEFVYNPATGDAKVVASLTKGAFRFVGARTSQTEGGAVVKTPVGTIGIRGAVTNVSYDPTANKANASLIAGNCISLSRDPAYPDDSCILYQPGFTASITGDDQGGATAEVHKSTKEETQIFQQQVSSKPGQSGGTSDPPDDTDVEQSEVSENNSELPESMVVPGDPKPVESTPLDQVEEDVADIDGATQDDINEDIEEGGGGEEPEEPDTLNARVLTAPDIYEADFDGGVFFPNAGSRGLVGSTPETDQIVAFARENGRLVTTDGAYNLPDFSGTEGDIALSQEDVTDGQSPFGPVSGTAYAGAGDFVAYMLGVNDDPTQPFYMIYGTPTGEAELATFATGVNVREYALTPDPIQNTPATFFNNELYQGTFAPGTFHTTNLMVIESGDSATEGIRGFQSWISIEGKGTSQKSAAYLFVGSVNADGDSLHLDSGRRGSFRHSAIDSATNLRGGIASLPGASGAHFFGPDADNFVIGTSPDPADTFFDSHHGSGFTGDPEDGYIGDGNFATHHVADLVDESPISGLTRTNGGEDGIMLGFMAGMGESENDGNIPYRLNSDGVINLGILFIPDHHAFHALGTVYDSAGDNDVVDNMLLTFSFHNDVDGANTYLDDTHYGAYQNSDPENTRLGTDDGEDIANDADDNPGSYIVSGRANPIDGYQHLGACTTCDFIQWGWWGTRVSTTTDEEEGPRRDYVHMGTWVAGELSDPDAIYNGDTLPFGGEATYTGTALGTVARETGEGVAQYIARGDMQMTWDFGDRTGELAITDFDGMNVSGTMTDPGDPGYPGEGTPTGQFGGFIGFSETLGGSASGAFVDNINAAPDQPNVAAGIIGDFSFEGVDLGQNVSAVGTFAGVGAAGVGGGGL